MQSRLFKYLLFSFCIGSSLFSAAGELNQQQLDTLLANANTPSVKRPSQITSIEQRALQSNDNRLYTLEWESYSSTAAWHLQYDLTEQIFRNAHNAAILKGLWLVDLEVYKTSEGLRYAGIWHTNINKRSQIVRSNISQASFVEQNITNVDKGFKLVTHKRIDVVDSKIGESVSAVWIEDRLERTRFNKRAQLEALFDTYLRDQQIAGLSIAISKNNKLVYTRGHGVADKESRQAVHAGTIFPLYGVSQAVSGVLALRIEEQGHLEDGVPINFSAKWPTSHLLLGIPKQHTHTFAELMAHSACLDTGAEHALSSTFRNAQAELSSGRYLQAIWHKSLLSNCSPGQSTVRSNQSYVYAAAVLEAATGQSVYSLVQNELIRPYGLRSLGFANSENAHASCPYGLVQQRCHAAQYRFDGQAVNGVVDLQPLAEGMEGSVIALQHFVTLLKGNDILSRKVRDTRLWAPLNQHAIYGMGWHIRSQGVVEQFGDGRGGSARLLVDRRNNISIALLSNQQSSPAELTKLLQSIRRLL